MLIRCFMEVMKMTRIWKMIAVALSSAYLLQLGGCLTGKGLNLIENIPGPTTDLWQTIQSYIPGLGT